MTTPAATDTKTIQDHWVFVSIGDLVRALREYTAMLDGTLVRRYGEERVQHGEPPPTPKEIEEYERAVLRQRHTIDIGMEHIEEVYPTWHRVINLYYRRALSCEPRGWVVVMARLGLRSRRCPGLVRCTIPEIAELEQGRLELPKCTKMTEFSCRWDHDTWRRQLALATEKLFHAIEVRSQWKP
ncbi:MAG: hypothetical protein JXA57_17850 [Armatimonadetes bacterium]|nr:hypothetical protein [Armatimonadota bacterium]